MLNIVLPAAGAGSRFAQNGFKDPKPFIDVDGIPMIDAVLKNLSIIDSRYIILIQQDHKIKYNYILDNLYKKYNIEYVFIDKLTEGAACSVLHAHYLINNNDPVMIANSDQIIDINIFDFIKDAKDRNLDGSILTFKADDPKWSYAKIDINGYVTEVIEKKVISNFATVGIYYFKNGQDFINSSLDMIVRNDRVNNEFYVCPTYNYSISRGKKIGIYNILPHQMHGIGTPEDLAIYLKKI